MVYPRLELSYELQVHSAAVTKLVTNFDNQVLFSGSEDGSFAFIQISDKDLRKRENIVAVSQTGEKVCSRLERELVRKEIARLQHELNSQQEMKSAEISAKQKVKQEEI